MKTFFDQIRKKRGSRQSAEQETVFGCVSRRESDSVIIAAQSDIPDDLFLLSKLARQASLENLRLGGIIRTVAAGYSGRTKRLADLSVGKVENGDSDNAEGKKGRDGDNLLEIGSNYINYLKRENVNLEEKRVGFTIDELGVVSGISVLKEDVEKAANSVEGFRRQSSQVCVETRGRAALRFYLWKLSRSADIALFPDSTCLALIEDNGYSIVFWEKTYGLFWEVEQPFVGDNREDNWSMAADELRRLLNQTSLTSLELNSVDRLAVVVEADCAVFLRDEFADDAIDFDEVKIIPDEDYHSVGGSNRIPDDQVEAVIAAGLYLTGELVPHIDLNVHLEDDIRNKENQQVLLTQKATKAASRNLAILLFAPVILAVLCIGIFYVSLYIQDSYIAERNANAERELAQLQPIADEIQKIKTSSDLVQAIGTQIKTLRQRQPASFLLLLSLNRLWPAGQDSWQIDEITSSADGTVKIKGRTTRDESITEFAKNLDFSDDFGGVKVSKAEKGASASGISPQDRASGVIEFAVETVYKPLGNALSPATGGGVNPVQPSAVSPPPTLEIKPQIAENTAAERKQGS